MRIIALEEHFTTPAIHAAAADSPLLTMYTLLAQAGMWSADGDVPPGITDIGAGRIAVMDRAGIDMQILSQTAPGAEAVPQEQAVRLAAEANDAMRAAIENHPGRFSAFACLPVTDPVAAAAEFDRAVTQLGFVGAMINGHVRGEYLDAPKYRPIFEKAAELDVPIYLHPTRPPQAVVDAQFSGFDPVITEMFAAAAYGWHADAGVHALRLILSGLFDELPTLQIIQGHMGETLPSMIWRVDERMHHLVTLKNSIRDTYTSHFSVTFAGIFDYAPLAAALHTLGADRVMFSVDYPYSDPAQGRAFLDSLPLSPDDVNKIAHRNAERLLRIPTP
ncbi:amidohydrolase family protein [Nocardia sp. NPDC052566]|uniref:amidohydrolase family protein n=1 Tax=Nocardia sp. NPDC052566 TaxID=3364330 RepID=UPI0037CA44F3